ncbi:MAG: MipA/OmpV family protein [Pseudomonadota bacterium]
MPVPSRFRAVLTAAALLVAALPAAPSRAQSLPVWEVGLGLGVISVPFYRGADAGRSYAFPVPYLKYRGRYLQVDEGGLRGKLFTSDRLLLDISVAAGVPVPASRDGARAGMRELHPTLEIGPQLEYRLWRVRDRDAAVWLHLPLRAAFSVNWNEFDDQGWVLAPFVEYETRGAGPGGPWKVGVGAGPLFATGGYHDYFYEVLPGQATAARPEYHADGGYSGSRLTLTAQKRYGDWWIGGFARLDSLSGAVFEDSPLVRENYYYAAGLAVSRLLATSRENVEVDLHLSRTDRE